MILVSLCFAIRKQTIVDFEVNASDNDDAIKDLHSRTIFVLETVRNFDDKKKWSSSDNAENIVNLITGPLKECSKLFAKYKSMSWFAKRIFSGDLGARITKADSALSGALSYVTLGLQFAMTEKLSSISFTKTEKDLEIEQLIIKAKGGVSDLTKNSDALRQVAEKMAEILGDKSREINDSMLAEVRVDFKTQFDALSANFDKVLELARQHGKSIDEAKAMLDELLRRGSAYNAIKCDAVRDLWLRSGWGARARTTVFVDVVVDEVLDEIDALIVEDSDITMELLAPKIQIFREALMDIDADKVRIVFFVFQPAHTVALTTLACMQTNNVSPKEVNSFFFMPDWSLLQYFNLIVFLFPLIEKDTYVFVAAQWAEPCAS